MVVFVLFDQVRFALLVSTAVSHLVRLTALRLVCSGEALAPSLVFLSAVFIDVLCVVCF